MKLFFLTMVLYSTNVFASLNCISTDKPGYRLTIVNKVIPQSTLTVRYKEKILYRKLVTSEINAPLVWSYTSAEFTNRNNAPAQVYISVSKINTALQGQFSEGSYLPVVPYLQLVCE